MNLFNLLQALPSFVLNVAIFTFVLLIIGIGLTIHEFRKDAKHIETLRRGKRKKP